VVQGQGGLTNIDDPCTPQIESISTYGRITIVTSNGASIYHTTQQGVDTISGNSVTLIENFATPSSTGETVINQTM
jgi:hypothetical protein